MSPGVQAAEQAGRTPVDPGGAVHAGEAGAGRERTANFMTAPWCQPRGPQPVAGGYRPLGRGGLEQLPGVRPGAVGVLEPGQHPGQLALPAGVVERLSRTW